MQKNRISINQIKNKQIMNKKVMKAVFVAAIAMVSVINVFNAQKSEALSDVALANVEALAEGESDLSQAVWNREDYTLDNGTPATNCWRGGNSDCILR